MSRPKAAIRSAVSACALALVALVAVVPGTALGADEGPPSDPAGLIKALSDQELPAGLENLDPGNSGIDLNQILPLLVEPDPNGGGQQTTAPDTSNNTAAAPTTPAASTPKHKKPARSKPAHRIADARSNRTRGQSSAPAGPKGPPGRSKRQPTITHPTAVRQAPETGGSSPPPPKPRSASPSIVNRVINRIPAEYKIALIGLGLLAFLFAAVSIRERRRSRRVERQAMVDALTALPNRQAFERRLAKEWRRAERYERSVGVLMLDLDDFKQINDGQGHAAGDRVLGEAAMLISGRVRSADMAARWGGDEFVVLCPETNAAGLKVLARSLEDRLRHAGIASSAGFAEREPDDLSPADLLARADVSMYARKQRERARPERRAVTLPDTRSSFASLSD